MKKDSKKPMQKKSSLETFAIDQNMTIDEIRENFPVIYAELTNKKMSMGIDEVEDNLILPSLQMEEKQNQDPFSNYEPNVYDFLRRAKTEEEGYEIIGFLAKQGQISSETEKKLTEKLKISGIRCFGSIRSSNNYFRKAEEIKNQKLIQKRYPSRIDGESKV
ncbi:MAG: DUF2095 family protein [Candidatus Hodarchaeales archaeon]|jgi:hypothetical protein